MIRLEDSRILQRKIRQDDLAELGINTWTLVSETIQAGKIDQALEFIDYGCTEYRTMQEGIISLLETFVTHLAGFGEEEVAKAFRARYVPIGRHWLSVAPGAEESLQWILELQRSLNGNCIVTEEPDRYVVTSDPCGSGGRLRRSRSVGVTDEAYPWSWSKSGVPYYCTHCCLRWEIIPIELRGYPIAFTFPGEKPEDPCIRFIYKKPELIPEEYFRRVGMTKTIKQCEA